MNILAHPEKIIFPKHKISKVMLADYYQSILKIILPYLKNRPLTLHRFPDGVGRKDFYQKNLEGHLPKYMRTEKIFADSTGDYVHYAMCNNKESLLYLLNLDCIDFNPWNATKRNLDMPTYMIIDFDPPDLSYFKTVVDVVRSACDILQKIGAAYFIKTSGSKGMHIYVPLNGKYMFDDVRVFAKKIVMKIHSENSSTTTIERHLADREGKIYLDHQQNSFGQTVACVYSVRPVADACVSAPVLEKELKNDLYPDQFNIFNMEKRLRKLGDIFENILSKNTNIEKCRLKLDI